MNKDTIKKLIIYGGGNLLNNLISLMIIPIITRQFLPEEYSIYSLSLQFIAFASLIYYLGMQQSIISFFYNEKTDSYKFTFICSVLIITLISSFFCSSIILLFRDKISLLIYNSSQYGTTILLLSFVLIFDVIRGISMSIFHIMEKSLQYSLHNIIKNSIMFTLLVFAYFSKILSIDIIIQLLLFTSFLSVIFTSIGIIRILKSLTKSNFAHRYFDIKLIKEMLLFGIPMIPGSLGFLILRISDRFMIGKLSINKLYDLGIYDVSYRLGMIMAFINFLIVAVYYPKIMQCKDKSTSNKMNKSVLNIYLILSTFLGSLIILFSSEIFQIFVGIDFRAGEKIVFFGVISAFLTGSRNIFNITLYKEKKSKLMAGIVVFGASINIGLNFIFIPIYGIYGAGFSSIIAYFILTSLNHYFSEKISFSGYRLANIFPSIIIFFVFAFINFKIESSIMFLWIKIIFSLIITSILIFWLYKKNENLLKRNPLLKK